MTDTEPEQPRYHRRRLALVLCFWGADAMLTLAHVFGTIAFRGPPPSWPHLAVTVLPGYLVWLLSMPGIFWLARRFRFEAGQWRVSVPVHLMASLVVGGMNVTLLAFIAHLQQPGDAPFGWPMIVAFAELRLAWSLVTYGAFLAFLLAAEYFEQADRSARLQLQASRLQSELVHAQLTALRAQLHPHFLFNALNSVSALVDENPAAAQRMIARLAALLRSSFSTDPRSLVPVREELAIVADYVEIERCRFADRLATSITCTPEAEQAAIPALLLQPLVENAVRHGIQPIARGGTVSVRVRREGSWLCVEVEDDGAGLRTPRSGHQGAHIGLANTRARLQTHFGAQQSFTIEEGSPSGTRVSIRFPFSLLPPRPVPEHPSTYGAGVAPGEPRFPAPREHAGTAPSA